MNDNKKSLLKKLYISGYKSISQDRPQSIELGDINIIIGANGVGKSNIISFFKMLGYMMTKALQQYVGENGFADNLLYMGAKKTPVMSARLEFKNSKMQDVYEFSLVKTVQDSLIFSEESLAVNGKRYPLDGGHKESFLTSGSSVRSSEKIVKMILSKCRCFQFHDTSATSHIRGKCRIDDNHYLMSDAGNAAAVLYLLKTKPEYSGYYNRIVQFVSDIFPLFDDFVLEPQRLNSSYINLSWRQKNSHEYVFGPEQFSDGSMRFIALATLFLAPPELLPNVIVIDEPELGLHPQAIDALCSMMRMASRSCQIVLATQSTRILDSFEPENIIVAEMDRVSRSSVFKRLDGNTLAQWLDEYSLSQLLEKNIIGGLPL